VERRRGLTGIRLKGRDASVTRYDAKLLDKAIEIFEIAQYVVAQLIRSPITVQSLQKPLAQGAIFGRSAQDI